MQVDTRSLREETKKKQGPVVKPRDIDLPVLEEVPVFQGSP